MARAGYGSDQVNPGILLVEKVYNYIQVGDSKWFTFVCWGVQRCFVLC